MKSPRFLLAALLLPAALSAAELDATLGWANRLTLATPVTGVVAEAPAAAGQRVKKGELLVALDPRPFEARRLRAAAALASAVEALAEAEREMERADELYERTVLSDHELNQASIALAAAKADHDAALAERDLADLELERSRLTAPFDAWVIERRVAAGETVVNRNEARPLVVVAEAGRMVARVELEGAHADTLELGASATVTVANRDYPGRLRAIALEPTAAGRYLAEVEFQVSEPLRAGRRAKVALP